MRGFLGLFSNEQHVGWWEIERREGEVEEKAEAAGSQAEA